MKWSMLILLVLFGACSIDETTIKQTCKIDKISTAFDRNGKFPVIMSCENNSKFEHFELFPNYSAIYKCNVHIRHNNNSYITKCTTT